MATRDSSGKVLNVLAKNIPWLLGGSADLAHSNKTNLTFEGAGDFFAGEYGGGHIYFLVCGPALGGPGNGPGGSRLRAYSAPVFFLSTSILPPTRVSSLLAHPSTFIFSH